MHTYDTIHLVQIKFLMEHRLSFDGQTFSFWLRALIFGDRIFCYISRQPWYRLAIKNILNLFERAENLLQNGYIKLFAGMLKFTRMKNRFF